MTLSPVTLDEFRAHINDTTSTSGRDDEMWSMVLSATRMVEARAGALEVREVSERVTPTYPYCGRVDDLNLTQWPLFGSVTAVTPVETAYGIPATFGFDSMVRDPYVYDVTYKVGRSPVPEDLRLCVLIVADQLWQSQRGPMTPARPGITPQTAVTSKGFAWPNRALEIIADYTSPALA